jgi:hypothetical protein
MEKFRLFNLAVIGVTATAIVLETDGQQHVENAQPVVPAHVFAPPVLQTSTGTLKGGSFAKATMTGTLSVTRTSLASRTFDLA